MLPGAPRAPFKRKFSRDSFMSSLKPRMLSYRRKSQKGSEESVASNSEDSQPLHDHKAASTAQASPSHGLQAPPPTVTKYSNHEGGNDSRQTTPAPSEPPIKRPKEADMSSGPIEEPLRRPRNSREEIAFSDIMATFAVDVSGSTEGTILEEEKATIGLICSGLSRDAQTQVQIIPWDHNAHQVLPPSELWALNSSGRTRPNCLNEDIDSKSALSQCSAWFLLTDGAIDDREVHQFSRGICEASLHGIPCVIILFGYKTSRPAEANISVGLSVFSHASDCLFLFHDVDSTQVYILQAKGKFKELLPSGYLELTLCRTTRWGGLPTFNYRQLFDLALPTRQHLQAHDLLLQSGQKVNLQNLYSQEIDSTVARDIMENDDDLKSVLLAAALSGRDDEIARWVSKQTVEAENILLCERPDINDQANQLLRKLLWLLGSKDKDLAEIIDIRQRLRAAHFANWGLFLAKAKKNIDQSAMRKTIVSDAMTRIGQNRKEMEAQTHSPVLMSPISPGIGELDDHHTQCYDYPTQCYDPFDPDSISGSSTNSFQLYELKRTLGKDAGVLYIKGFKEDFSSACIKGGCPLCSEDDISLMALIKAPPKDLVTPGFPSSGERKGLVYPLAMGSYPETDILSSSVCCDSCAFTMISQKIPINDDLITAAIPLSGTTFSGQYKQTAFDLIDNALQKRFHESAVLLVFLAVIYTTIANIDGDSSENRLGSLTQMACLVVYTASLPLDLSMSTTETTPRTGTFGDLRPLRNVISETLQKIHNADSPLLQYPLGGFVVLSLAARDLKPKLISLEDQRQIAVWHRFLYYLVEKHCEYAKADEAGAVAALNIILQASDTPHIRRDAVSGQGVDATAGSPGPQMELDPPNCGELSCSSLRGTHLLSEEDLDEFERLGELLEPVVRKCVLGLRPFLQRLSEETLKSILAIDVFDTMRALDDLNDIFRIK